MIRSPFSPHPNQAKAASLGEGIKAVIKIGRNTLNPLSSHPSSHPSSRPSSRPSTHKEYVGPVTALHEIHIDPFGVQAHRDFISAISHGDRLAVVLVSPTYTGFECVGKTGFIIVKVAGEGGVVGGEDGGEGGERDDSGGGGER